MSETDTCREILLPWCQGIGLDIGFGGSAISPTAITFDMYKPYTEVGGDRQILRGDAATLPFVCDNALDYIHSSHLLEDWTYHDLLPVLQEWRRVLKVGGYLVTNCPDQQKFLAHCAKTSQGLNLAHKEPDFSLATFRVLLSLTGPWEQVFVEPEHGPYSWLLVVRKVEL